MQHVIKMEQTDRMLLENIRKGNHWAFRKWYERYFIRYLSFACTLLPRDEAEDIVQISFIKFWNRREKIDLEKSIHSFMLTIIKNEILSLMRTPYKGRKMDIYYENANMFAGDGGTDYENKDRLDYYLSVVDQLPPKRREVFKLSRLENNSNDEIAKKMGLSKRTVEKHLELALKQLRNLSD